MAHRRSKLSFSARKPSMDPFTFLKSRELRLPVYVRIDTLEGTRTQLPFTKLLADPSLKHIGSNTSPHSDVYITVQVYADSKPLTVPVTTSYKAFRSQRTWMEWLTLPVHYSDLPLSAQLAITVWDLAGPGQTVPLGGTTVRLFDKDTTLKKGRQKCKIWTGVEADGLNDTTTPSPVESNHEMDRLEKLVKKHELGELPRLDWLDNLAFRQIERINKQSSAASKDEHFLFIDFPRFDFPIVYTDHEYSAHSLNTPSSLSPTASSAAVPPRPLPNLVSDIPGATGTAVGGSLLKVYDPDDPRDNPAEAKHRRLMRSHRNGPLDRDLKPNPKIRDEINEILNYSPTHELTSEEKDLLWKFRFYLARDKRALTKFVKSVSWSDPSESKQAVQLLPMWTEIDVDDALELLGPNITNGSVRAYAVGRLRKSDDEELQLYLLQLVQALKFERIKPDIGGEATKDSSLAKFLIHRASKNQKLGNFFNWYLMVETEDPDSTIKKLYSKIGWEFQVALRKEENGDKTRAIMKRQADFVFMIGEISREIQGMRENRLKKVDRLKSLLRDPKNDLLSFDPIPLPLDPSINVVGCFPEESNVFKSSLFPLLIHLKTDDGSKYPIIFKSGDDLRQDQLVIQIVILMDKLLRKENLDLKLTPYRILATSAFTGIVQFVASLSLATIEEGKHAPAAGVLPYLKNNYPDETQEYGVKAEVMDTYVKSCAGYCVITYLLGVGDRHLDNLLLTPDGHFFHADFGFILGRDPKPFAPAMKLCREMVDGMGGAQSVHFSNFKSYCFTAYTTLRKSANLILNLFALMVEANIPDIRMEPDKAVLKVKERFCLEMSEEEAIRHFGVLIEDSMNSVLPVLMDRVHGIAQRWRK